jgi:hypothetical protein
MNFHLYEKLQLFFIVLLRSGHTCFVCSICLIPHQFTKLIASAINGRGVFWNVERFTKADQACMLAAAAAHDFNNELTVILSSISNLIESLDPDHPALEQARDLQDAARRCACKTSGLLRFGLKRGNRPMRTALEALIDEGAR